jgi:hypothetical protein
MSKIRIPLLGVLLVGFAACAPQRPTLQAGPTARGLQIEVENESTTNLRVLARMGSNEVLLGRVDGMQTRRFRLPRGVTGNMQLVARMSAASPSEAGHFSEPFTATTGQKITWRLRESPGTASLPRLSSLYVFSCVDEVDC